jgi:hypothetical protein
MGILKMFKKKPKKNIVITQKEHDEWHRKNRDYGAKSGREHDACHRKFGIRIKKS